MLYKLLIISISTINKLNFEEFVSLFSKWENINKQLPKEVMQMTGHNVF